MCVRLLLAERQISHDNCHQLMAEIMSNATKFIEMPPTVSKKQFHFDGTATTNDRQARLVRINLYQERFGLNGLFCRSQKKGVTDVRRNNEHWI